MKNDSPLIRILAFVGIVVAVFLVYIWFLRGPATEIHYTAEDHAAAAHEDAGQGDDAASTDTHQVDTGALDILAILSGSQTIGNALAPDLAEAWLTASGAASVKRAAGEGANAELVLGEFPDGSLRGVIIRSQGTASGFEDLNDGACDLAMASRRITQEEAQTLAHLGDMFSAQSEHILGLDGLAVIAHPSNPVNALRLNQVAALFTGQAQNWADVGGYAWPLTIYVGPDDSGTFETFKALVLGDQALAATVIRLGSSDEVSAAVAKDPTGVGFCGLPSVGGAKALMIADGDSSAIAPTTMTVSTEDYPLVRRLYLYAPSAPARPEVMDFVEFALSGQGQEAVKANGFVNLTIAAAEAGAMPALNAGDAAAGTPMAAYLEAIQGGQRLSVNFRFRTGSSELDNRAQRDLDRLAAYLTASGGEIVLAGFTDNVGDPAANLALGQERAEAVAQGLTERGAAVGAVISLGVEAPVASNETEEGRQRNRRVEVWVK